MRGVLPNTDRALLPGYFVRVRVPRTEQPDTLLVPDRVIGSDQSGRYVLVANKDDVIEQRKVELGQQVGRTACHRERDHARRPSRHFRADDGGAGAENRAGSENDYREPAPEAAP